MIESKALEVNLASYHVDVKIDPKYQSIQEVMSKYYGLMESLNTFLKELSHPFRNLQFITNEARGYCLDYFHLFRNHEEGPEAARLFVNIFLTAITESKNPEVKTDSIDNLLLFLQKMIKDSGTEIERFLPVLNEAFDQITRFDDEYFFFFVKSFYQINRLADIFRENTEAIVSDFSTVNGLLYRYFQTTYSYWLNQDDPQTWLENEVEGVKERENLFDLFHDISHKYIKSLEASLDAVTRRYPRSSSQLLDELVELPGYTYFVDIYRKIPEKLLEADKETGWAYHLKVIFLFHIMNIPGLSMIHEETIREINRTLSRLISRENYRNISRLIQRTFSILQDRFENYPVPTLNCVLNMGKGVYKTHESDLVKEFINSVIHLGFQPPKIRGVGDDWQIQVNPAHIINIRVWLELIGLNPRWSTPLLSTLIINISLYSVFIRDNDLFPRDITNLLNSKIEPVYNLVKQLARLFPVYFNDIGAEGDLRDISTEIDELTNRRDVLIHFLRKQSHVESSNQIVGLMEAIIVFWSTLDKTILKPFIPPNIYEQIETTGIYVDDVHQIMSVLENKGYQLPEGLLTIKDENLKKILEGLPTISYTDKRRVELAVSLYKHLTHKYKFDFIEIKEYLSHLKLDLLPDIEGLKTALENTDPVRRIYGILDYLEQLKAIILSPETYEIREDIYKKRHFTIDIPSMYGSYHEKKFDALGLDLRLESLLNILLEEIIESFDLGLITKATFFQVHDYLKLFYRALKLDGISSVEYERQLELLEHSLLIKGFTFTQYLDIFKGFAQVVSNIIHDYFHNIHEPNLSEILPWISPTNLLPKYFPQNGQEPYDKLEHRISEIFYRDRIASSLGLQQLDLFISRILNRLYHQSNKLPKEKLHQLLIYNPHNSIMSLEMAGSNGMPGIIHLGSKGANLVKLASFGMPVPHAFIVTTEVFRSREMIFSYSPAENHLKRHVKRHITMIEKATGKRFGDKKNPLLFSVRSGSSISQPGMMDTFLNVGINEDIVEGIAQKTGNKWFAWDNYRRFLQGYGMSFYLKRDDFDAIMRTYKDRWGIPLKRDFSGEQMKEVARAYKIMIMEAGIEIIEKPFDQLYLAVKKVFSSWESSKAKTYRKIMGISDDWGTAVTVQSMVYGNISQMSGTGVIFTHNPRWSSDTIRLWGDFTCGNQGEDVVSGLVNTLPISLMQQEFEMRQTDITLETHFPEIYKALRNWAAELIEKRGWTPQEMEFTFESPSMKDLFILQTRDMAIREHKKASTFDINENISNKLLGHGVGVSGGAMSGKMVFTLEEIDKARIEEPDTPLILIRSDTVPDDIREINAADGILTARGGLTSHAAVVAHRLGKTCVVGCGNLECREKERICLFGDVLLKSGDFISIDGQEGSVYQGLIQAKP